MASRFLKLSELLQKYRTPVVLVSCGGLFAANLSYHVFPNLTYRQLYQAWYKGEPEELTEKLEDLFQQVLKDYGVKSSKNFSAFVCFGFHPVGAGIPWLPAGAHIGIPTNFNSSPDDPSGLTNRNLFIDGKVMNWSSEAACTLKEALLFSTDAQKFAVAREVARLQSGGTILGAAVAPFCLAGVWVYSMVLKLVFGLHGGPLLFRGFANVVALGIGAVSYFLASDAVSHWLDYRTDRRAAGVSREYAKGGVEFYDKILSRNKTLRSMMGQKGKKMFADSGNLLPTNVLQLKHTPYTSRRKGILALLENEETRKKIEMCNCTD